MCLFSNPQGEAGPSIFSLGILCFSSFTAFFIILFMSILSVVVTFSVIVEFQKNVLHSKFHSNGLVSFTEKKPLRKTAPKSAVLSTIPTPTSMRAKAA